MILELFTLCTNEGREEEKEVCLTMDVFQSKIGVFPIIKKEPFMLQDRKSVV